MKLAVKCFTQALRGAFVSREVVGLSHSLSVSLTEESSAGAMAHGRTGCPLWARAGRQRAADTGANQDPAEQHLQVTER